MYKKFIKSFLISFIIIIFIKIIGQYNLLSYIGGMLYQFIVSEHIFKD